MTKKPLIEKICTSLPKKPSPQTMGFANGSEGYKLRRIQLKKSRASF